MTQNTQCEKIKFLDIFGYEDKTNRTRSYVGAFLSILTFSFLCFATNQALTNIKDGYSTQSVHMHGLAEIPYKMPVIAVTFSRSLAKHKYLNFNESWAKIEFHHRTIYESDKNKNKPRKKVNLGTRRCKVETNP
jgi:hypothetical protein